MPLHKFTSKKVFSSIFDEILLIVIFVVLANDFLVLGRSEIWPVTAQESLSWEFS
jgi:hypothetical protein